MKQFDTGNWFFNLVLSGYFSKKESDSRMIAKGSPKEPLPRITGNNNHEIITKASDYIIKNLKYVADPLTFDYYTHPETVQFEVNHGKTTYGKDCDDFSSYAYLLLKNSGINNISVVTIIPQILPDLTQIKWCHVILLGFYHDKSDNTFWAYTIDTNGLFWYKFPLPSFLGDYNQNLKAVEKEVLKKFSGLYNTNYVLMIDHGYPF